LKHIYKRLIINIKKKLPFRNLLLSSIFAVCLKHNRGGKGELSAPLIQINVQVFTSIYFAGANTCLPTG
ncbi:MAG: hypothetical protein KBG24_12875, partial [Bacteroidia bacterium]|nr:hypothetical protein [Bacteroidia bacterium]